MAFHALGASARAVPAQAALTGLDAYEQQLGAIAGNRYYRQAKYVTANLDLWPRPLVFFAGRRRWASLSAEQRRLLREAARTALPAFADVARADDRTATRTLCAAGMKLVRATPAELAALRRAVAPVYAKLGENPRTRSFIARIRALERDGDTRAEAAPCGSRRSRGGGKTAVDGVYRMTTKYGDNPSDATPVPENYGEWTFVFDRGHFGITQEYKDACTWGYGWFTLKGDEMAWTFTDGGGIAPTGAMNRPGEHFRFHWSRYRDTLTLSAVKGSGLPENEISPGNFRVKPWHVVSSTPSRRYFAKKCPPPKEALP
jgi:hypothetical protein